MTGVDASPDVGPDGARPTPRPAVWIVAGVVAVSSLVLAARVLRAGYGADNDTFLMLGVWDVLVDTGRYVPSRYQGYPVAELVVGAASAAGGHWASGLVALAFGIGCVVALDRLLRPRADPDARVLLTVTLVAAPAFVVASSTAIDYVYGLFFFLLGWALLERGSRAAFAGGVASLVLAAGARATYLPAALILIVASRHASPRVRAVAVAACAIASFAWYVPAWRHHGGVAPLLRADRPTGQGVQGLLARAGADGIGLLGLAGSVLVLATVVIATRQRRDGTARPESALLVDPVALPVLGGYFAVLWLAVPVEPSYLLPLLAVALVAAAPIRSRRGLLAASALVVMLHGWVVLEPYRVEYSNRYGVDSCEPTEAVDAAPDLIVGAGDLLGYPREVADNAACNAALRREFVDRWTD